MKWRDHKHLYAHALLTLAVVAVVAVEGYVLWGPRVPVAEEPSPPTLDQDTITIGWIGPLTGPVSFLGVENFRAIDMAIAEYNAKRADDEPAIEFVAEDDQYRADVSLALYETMVRKKRPAIIFMNTYSAMFPVMKRAEADGVIIVNPLDNDRHLAGVSQNVFLIAKRSEELGQAMADDIILSGNETVLICYNSSDDFMPAVAFGLQDKLQAAKVNVLTHNYTQLGEDEIHQHSDLAMKIQPDAHVFLGYGETGTLMKDYRQMGLDGTFYAINRAAEETAGEAFEGAHILRLDEGERVLSATSFFEGVYEKRYQAPIVHRWVAFQAYDAVNIVLNAVRKSHVAGLSVDTLRQELLRTDSYPGLSGTITIDERGAAQGISWSLYTVENGRLIKK